MKQKFIDAHMSVAETYAKLSSAKRLQVGAVLVKNDTIIGIGYNGMPSGWDNVCEEVVTPTLPYLSGDGPMLKTKDEVIHAESNCLMKVAKSTNSTEGADMFVTHAPCIHCAKLIYQSGVRKVYYRSAYRDVNGVEFLEKSGIEVERV
jgi:dCMP deaminase